MLAHVVEVMGDRMHHEDGYTEQDEATMTKLEELSKAGPALTATSGPQDYRAELGMFMRVLDAELDNWVPDASQRLLFRARRVLGADGIPDPAYGRSDCGPERGDHALFTDWIGDRYVHRCASCFRLYRA